MAARGEATATPGPNYPYTYLVRSYHFMQVIAHDSGD
jgi:hypothetical protein